MCLSVCLSKKLICQLVLVNVELKALAVQAGCSHAFACKRWHVAAMTEVKGKEAKSGADILKWANEKGEFQHKASTFRTVN